VKSLYIHVYKIHAFVLNFDLAFRGRSTAAPAPLGARLVHTVVERMLFIKRQQQQQQAVMQCPSVNAASTARVNINKHSCTSKKNSKMFGSMNF